MISMELFQKLYHRYLKDRMQHTVRPARPHRGTSRVGFRKDLCLNQSCFCYIQRTCKEVFIERHRFLPHLNGACSPSTTVLFQNRIWHRHDCVDDVAIWMPPNRLQLNTRRRGCCGAHQTGGSIKFGSLVSGLARMTYDVMSSAFVRNLGIYVNANVSIFHTDTCFEES